jgi:ribonuclease P protein component
MKRSAKTDFERVFRHGKTLFFDGLAVKYLKKAEPRPVRRFSFGKGKVGLATERHRLRRRIQGALLRHAEPVLEGYDMIFYVPKKLGPKPNPDIEGLVKSLIRSLPKAK